MRHTRTVAAAGALVLAVSLSGCATIELLSRGAKEPAECLTEPTLPEQEVPFEALADVLVKGGIAATDSTPTLAVEVYRVQAAACTQTDGMQSATCAPAGEGSGSLGFGRELTESLAHHGVEGVESVTATYVRPDFFVGHIRVTAWHTATVQTARAVHRELSRVVEPCESANDWFVGGVFGLSVFVVEAQASAASPLATHDQLLTVLNGWTAVDTPLRAAITG